MAADKPISGRIEVMGYYDGRQWKQARTVINPEGVSPTLTAEMGSHGNNFIWIMEEEDG